MTNRNELIDQLSGDLPPVKTVGRPMLRAFAWFAVSAIYVMAVTQWFGPLRPGAVSQLLSEPRFLLESTLGVLAIAWVAVAAFRAAIPARLGKGFAIAGAVLMTLWLLNYVVGLVSPALEPSMLGKRPHCFAETLAYAVPPILLGLLMIRRLYPLSPVRNAMLLSLAAGMLPALYMQLACMYAADHILMFHILPGLVMVLPGALFGLLILRKYR